MRLFDVPWQVEPDCHDDDELLRTMLASLVEAHGEQIVDELDESVVEVRRYHFDFLGLVQQLLLPLVGSHCFHLLVLRHWDGHCYFLEVHYFQQILLVQELQFIPLVGLVFDHHPNHHLPWHKTLEYEVGVHLIDDGPLLVRLQDHSILEILALLDPCDLESDVLLGGARLPPLQRLGRELGGL